MATDWSYIYDEQLIMFPDSSSHKQLAPKPGYLQTMKSILRIVLCCLSLDELVHPDEEDEKWYENIKISANDITLYDDRKRRARYRSRRRRETHGEYDWFDGHSRTSFVNHARDRYTPYDWSPRTS